MMYGSFLFIVFSPAGNAGFFLTNSNVKNGSMNIDQIFENNRDWVKQKLNLDPNYFKNLSKGQSPEILYIGCSDSRVTAEELMGVNPGDAFVHRNIANMVPNTDLSSMSVIDYAVAHLKVSHIIVCGHYYCGGVKAAMQSADLGILNPWLRNIRDVYRIHRKELNAIENEDEKYRRLVELNVQEQCINVIKTAEIQQAYRDRNITVHGWVFDIHSGKIIDLKIDFEKILEGIMEIYSLS
jgi:carbonic anhydrase